MAPIEVKTKKGKQTMQVDEHARPQTTLEQLQKLPPVFKKEGTVTAGNASVCHASACALSKWLGSLFQMCLDASRSLLAFSCLTVLGAFVFCSFEFS